MFNIRFPNYTTYNNIIGGVPQTLKSKFKLNYSLTIQLLKAYDDGNILQNSKQFVKSSMMHETLQKRIGASEETLNSITGLCKSKTVFNEQNKLNVSSEQLELCKHYD